MILGLAGFAGTGKDSVARYLAEHHGFDHIAFADPLRSITAELNPLIRATTREGAHILGDERRWSANYLLEVRGYRWLKENTTYRDFLVALGAGARTHISADVWVRAAEERIRRSTAPGVVISDVRYSNEARMIKGWYLGHVVLLHRPGYGPANGEEAASFAELHGLDTITNDGDIYDLYRKIDSYIDATTSLPL